MPHKTQHSSNDASGIISVVKVSSRREELHLDKLKPIHRGDHEDEV